MFHCEDWRVILCVIPRVRRSFNEGWECFFVKQKNVTRDAWQASDEWRETKPLDEIN